MAVDRPGLGTVTNGLVVAVVGFFSSFPVVLQGLQGVGASAAEASSGLMAAALSMGIAGIVFSLITRQPVSVAWSTPGAALLAVSTPLADGFAGAIAAFLAAGALTVAAGLWRPLGRLAEAIPVPLAQAMLAGAILPLCLAPFRALETVPFLILPLLATWLLAGFVHRLLAVPAMVAVAGVLIAVTGDLSGLDGAAVLPAPVVTAPVFSLPAVIGLGVPLFIVTMATQNIPAIAILRSYGYGPVPGPLFASVGGFSLLTAPFGAHSTCLAAITSAMCAGPEAEPDPARRYWSAVFAGLFYSVFGLLAGLITWFAGLAPEGVVPAVAGIALMGVLFNSLTGALKEETMREAAGITFLVTASGVMLFGLGGAVWGLALGGLVSWLKRRRT